MSLHEELRRQAERQLVEFLRTDLELVRIFVESAALQLRMGELENYRKLLDEAAKGINTIHYFEERVSDPQIRAEIQLELEKIEKLLFSAEKDYLN